MIILNKGIYYFILLMAVKCLSLTMLSLLHMYRPTRQTQIKVRKKNFFDTVVNAFRLVLLLLSDMYCATCCAIMQT